MHSCWFSPFIQYRQNTTTENAVLLGFFHSGKQSWMRLVCQYVI
uniref:Uncharacterized protein n=1 Tax=Anguilla anguilla TaxID=7936 RepID=A0A0E9PBE1_ANGAN